MTADQIRTFRRALKEDVDTFGARFARSGRTIENWEQGHRVPDALAQRELERLATETDVHAAADKMFRKRRLLLKRLSTR